MCSTATALCALFVPTTCGSADWLLPSAEDQVDRLLIGNDHQFGLVESVRLVWQIDKSWLTHAPLILIGHLTRVNVVCFPSVCRFRAAESTHVPTPRSSSVFVAHSHQRERHVTCVSLHLHRLASIRPPDARLSSLAHLMRRRSDGMGHLSGEPAGTLKHETDPLSADYPTCSRRAEMLACALQTTTNRLVVSPFSCRCLRQTFPNFKVKNTFSIYNRDEAEDHDDSTTGARKRDKMRAAKKEKHSGPNALAYPCSSEGQSRAFDCWFSCIDG